MKQVTTYGVRIHAESMKPIQDMVYTYRQVVSFLIRVCVEQWEQVSALPSLIKQKTLVERLVHHTKDRPVVQYEDFDSVFYKLPCYIRRAAISEAIGRVESYQSNLKAWRKNPVGKEPGIPNAGHTYPVLYEGNMFEQTGDYSARIKVWIRNTWDWIPVFFRKSDADYIMRHCGDRHKLCPSIVRKGRTWELMFPFEEEVDLRDVELQNQKVLAVDLGINNACACSVMKSDGTIADRRMLRLPVQEDCLNHLLNKVKKAYKQGHKHIPTLWSAISNTNHEIAVQTARFVAETAEMYHVDMIVFEMLDIGGKKKGTKSRRQRLHLWKCRDVQSMVMCKAHRMGIRVSHVNARNTSSLAFDGSGKVERGINNNYSICRFPTGKIYNCDLNASYNIGARYFIREILKTLAVTPGLGTSAKVPECTRRSTCTLSTLLNLNAAMAA